MPQLCSRPSARSNSGGRWESLGEVLMPYFLGMLAQAYASAGRTEEALGALAESEAALDESGEAWWQAELYRLKGEFILRGPAPNEKQAEEFFRQGAG